jgi:hypothetical protein
MGEAGSDHHTIDELFQILCVRNIPPVEARQQILEACQRNKLKIDFRFRNGPSGRIHYQSWELMLTLSINKEGQLVVEPTGNLGYPWNAYPWDACSFTIANWSVINELWPPRVMTFVPPAVPIKPAAPIANAPTAPVTEAPASKTDPPTKISQSKWAKDYLTKDKKGELSKNHDQVSKAADEVFNAMKADSRVTPYKNARSLERHLAGIFPKRRKPRK